MLYSAVTPVLPHYAHEFSASKPAIGFFAAAYPAGMVPGSLLGGWLAIRAGVRRTTVVGLLIFASRSPPSGSARHRRARRAAVRAGSRVRLHLGRRPRLGDRDRSPRAPRRDSGHVIAAAIFGTLLGPSLERSRSPLSTEVVFSFVARSPAYSRSGRSSTPSRHGPRRGKPAGARCWRAARGRSSGFWLVLLEAGTFGATGCCCRCGCIGSAPPGSRSASPSCSPRCSAHCRAARRSRRRPPRSGPAAVRRTRDGGGADRVAARARFGAGLAALSVVALGGPLTAYMIPAMSMITDAAERTGVAIAFATMMLNLAWALGETSAPPRRPHLAGDERHRADPDPLGDHARDVDPGRPRAAAQAPARAGVGGTHTATAGEPRPGRERVSAAADLPHLRSPIELGPARLRNRLVSTSHQTGLVHDHLPTDDLIAYHAARARGGVGAIFLEATAVHESGLLTPHTIGGFLPQIVAAYERLCEPSTSTARGCWCSSSTAAASRSRARRNRRRSPPRRSPACASSPSPGRYGRRDQGADRRLRRLRRLPAREGSTASRSRSRTAICRRSSSRSSAIGGTTDTTARQATPLRARGAPGGAGRRRSRLAVGVRLSADELTPGGLDTRQARRSQPNCTRAGWWTSSRWRWATRRFPPPRPGSRPRRRRRATRLRFPPPGSAPWSPR